MMDLSVVIPTFNEEENVRTLTERIMKVLYQSNYIYELIFVDDSQDDTPTVLEELSRQYSEVNYIHRHSNRGLGTAVVEGINRAQGRFIIVMDADLQHPPEIIPSICLALSESAEVVIPSRFVLGGVDGGLNLFRKGVSWTARMMGRLWIKRIRSISDCTSGYFGVRRQVLEGVQLNPIGWKILMEILVKGNYHTVHEIPYSFQERTYGKSKMNIRDQWHYILHIYKLVRSSPEDRRFYVFCMVGGLGVLVNLLCLNLLQYQFDIEGLTASVCASVIAMTHNFIWHNKISWQAEQLNQTFLRRFLRFPQFLLVSGIGIFITLVFVRASLWMNEPLWQGQLIGIMAATAWNYLANDRWTWSETRKTEHTARSIQISIESRDQVWKPL
jgi:dolichol-phosphate mannosyltransferase